MGTWLDETLKQARWDGAQHVIEPPVNRLQPVIVEDGRLLARLDPRVVVVESAELLGVRERVCFVLYDPRDRRRVALDLLPEALDVQLSSREHVQSILACGDVDALVTFRGKDIVRNLPDCMCLFARLEHRMFTDHGFEHARIEANPGARRAELHRHGTTFVRVPWMDDEGELRGRSVRVTRRSRRLPRPARAA